VLGSESRPYSIVIKIKPLGNLIWGKIKNICEGKLDSLQELLVGKFPKALDEIFMAHGNGLFPAPKEINFDCSCPDSAYMCKHVAATLYGVGARLDEDPNLFFTLRKIEINDLITEAVKDKTKKLLTKAKKKSGRIIEDQDLSSVFGIELDSVSSPAKKVTAKATSKGKIPKTKKTSVKTKKILSKQSLKKTVENASKNGTKKTTTKRIKKAAKGTEKVKVTKIPTKKSKAKTPDTPVKKIPKLKRTKKSVNKTTKKMTKVSEKAVTTKKPKKKTMRIPN
jgi:uncharacterized Zn finger protein